MRIWDKYIIMVRAQLLIVPLLFFSCGNREPQLVIQYADSTATMLSYDHTMIYAGNGINRYRMYAPEIRRYEFAQEPYTEYPKGIKVQSFADSSDEVIAGDLKADYAILWEKSNMWEARGNIVGNNFAEKKRVETDVLFWDQTNGLIYNDHFTKVLDGGNWWIGYGFQTDDSFSRWRFNRSRGQMEVNRGQLSDTAHIYRIEERDSINAEKEKQESIIFEEEIIL